MKKVGRLKVRWVFFFTFSKWTPARWWSHGSSELQLFCWCDESLTQPFPALPHRPNLSLGTLRHPNRSEHIQIHFKYTFNILDILYKSVYLYILYIYMYIYISFYTFCVFKLLEVCTTLHCSLEGLACWARFDLQKQSGTLEIYHVIKICLDPKASSFQVLKTKKLLRHVKTNIFATTNWLSVAFQCEEILVPDVLRHFSDPMSGCLLYSFVDSTLWLLLMLEKGVNGSQLSSLV